MLTFRQKLLLSYLGVFFVFLIVLFPLGSGAVKLIVRRTLEARTNLVIAKAKQADSLKEMVAVLDAGEPFRFFRVALIDRNGMILYDSMGDQLELPRGGKIFLEQHPEVAQAFSRGSAFGESFSHSLDQVLVILAQRFSFQGDVYVMRTGFPGKDLHELTDAFILGFFLIGIVLLFLFSLMTSVITHNLTRPIRKIIQAIKPYQEGKVGQIPQIQFGSRSSKDEFRRLGDTLNSLTSRIERQITALEHERDEKEAVLETLTEGVLAVDGELVVTFVNSKACQLLSIASDNLIDQPFSALPELVDLLEECMTQKEILAVTLEIGESSQTVVDGIAVPRKTGNGAVLIMQDKSLQYRVVEMRKDFTAYASHELRTPLTIIRGFAETLNEGVREHKLSWETVESITDKISANCQRMEHLVKSLLRLSDVDHMPAATLRKCQVFELIERAAAITYSVHPDAVIAIEGNKNALCQGDSELLELAITNLFENAAKYSQGPAHISAKIEGPVEGVVHITVADKGIGIPKEDLPHIFQRFYTVDKAHSRKLGGAGLGLSIVKTIITKHGGKIAVDSEMGQGTTFSISLNAYENN